MQGSERKNGANSQLGMEINTTDEDENMHDAQERNGLLHNKEKKRDFDAKV